MVGTAAGDATRGAGPRGVGLGDSETGRDPAETGRALLSGLLGARNTLRGMGGQRYLPTHAVKSYEMYEM